MHGQLYCKLWGKGRQNVWTVHLKKKREKGLKNQQTHKKKSENKKVSAESFGDRFINAEV